MVRGLDRLTRTGIAILFVGIFVAVGLGLAFTQSPEIANPFVDTFNFNTVEESFPLLRLHPTTTSGDDPTGTPPSGQFITCFNQIDGLFCTDILQSVNLICKLKQAVEYQFIDGTVKTITSSDFDSFGLVIPEIPTFAITDPTRPLSAENEIENFNVQVRLKCDVPILKDGTRLPFFVTAETGRLAINVEANDEFGNTQTVLVTRAVSIPRTEFIDSGFLTIGSERTLGSVNVRASEIENVLNPSRDFTTRILIDLSGKLFIEIPDLNSATNRFVVTKDIGLREGFTSGINPVALLLDLFVDTPTSASTVFKTTVSSIQPDKLVVNGNPLTISKVNIFFTMTSYSDSEGSPDCELRKKQVGFFASGLLQEVKGVKQRTTGGDSSFSCQFPIKGDTDTGFYEVKITTPQDTTGGGSRPQTTTTFIITLATDESPLDTPTVCPTVSVLREQIKALDQATLLQQKADLLDSQQKGTLTSCDLLKLPLVIAEVASRGLTNTPTPTPTPNGGEDTVCTPPQIRTKIGATTFVCVNPAGASGGGLAGLLPKFIACAQGVTADTNAGEICLPASVFSIYNFVINNLLIVGIGIVVFLIVVKVIMVSIGRAKGGVVLKP